jgi:type IV secretion system protein VirD4
MGLLLPILALLVLTAGLQASTQFFAHIFQYHDALGSHNGAFYPPWRILSWAAAWRNVYPSEFMKAGSVGVLVAGVGLIILMLVQLLLANSAKASEYLHGSARWANVRDIRAAGLLPRRNALDILCGRERQASGVYVGAWLDRRGRLHYLRHDGPEHVLTYAPTRSGKGVGLVIPTLLSWPHSAVVTDLKGELWAITAGWRQRHARNKVLRFEPAAPEGGVRWNPLDEVRLGTEHEVGDVQNLATLIVDPDGRGLESHWQKTSQALIVGVILHALYKARLEGIPANLPVVDAMLSDPNRSVGDLWAEMIVYEHVGGRNHPVIGAAARDMLDRPEEEAGSVLSTAKSYLALYRDPIVARNVACSDFSVMDLMHHSSPVSLFIVTQPNDKSRLRPVVRVLVNMIVRRLADRMAFEGGRPVPHYRHRLLMMFDEFPSLGKLEIMQESLGFLAGFGIKCYLICQDINQLKSRETGYGHDESITSSCHIQCAYPPNRMETAEYLSKHTGETTVIKEQITTSGHRTSALLGQVSRTIQESARPLLTPDECMRMPGPVKNEAGDIVKAGDMVIYVSGCPAIYGRQPLYFEDPNFKARAMVPIPAASDRLHYVAEDTGEWIEL